MKTDPRNGIAYNNRGLAHSEIGQGDEALVDFAKAMECLPTNPTSSRPLYFKPGKKRRNKIEQR
jgi:hypothetical protein